MSTWCVKVLELESKLDEGRAEAAKTLSEIVRVQTQKEELVANLEAKRMAHEQAVVSLSVQHHSSMPFGIFLILFFVRVQCCGRVIGTRTGERRGKRA